MKMLAKMLEIAAVAHANQFDKGGEPYFLHVLTVMHKLRTKNEARRCIAIGHDLFEDTDVTPEYLRTQGISERVIHGIQCMTKIEGETQEQYELRVLSNVDTIHVKRADLLHNSDLRRLKGVTEKDLARAAKYQKFFDRLTKALTDE